MTQPDTSSAPEMCLREARDDGCPSWMGPDKGCNEAADVDKLRDQLAQRTVELTKCETAYHEQADRADAERAERDAALARAENAEAQVERLRCRVQGAVEFVEMAGCATNSGDEGNPCCQECWGGNHHHAKDCRLATWLKNAAAEAAKGANP